MSALLMMVVRALEVVEDMGALEVRPLGQGAGELTAAVDMAMMLARTTARPTTETTVARRPSGIRPPAASSMNTTLVLTRMLLPAGRIP